MFKPLKFSESGGAKRRWFKGRKLVIKYKLGEAAQVGRCNGNVNRFWAGVEAVVEELVTTFTLFLGLGPAKYFGFLAF